MALQRTPPPCKSASESDLSDKMLVGEELEHVTQRNNKRLRPCNSPQEKDSLQNEDQSELTVFKRDLLDMLGSWKKDQDTRFDSWKREQNETLSILTRDILHLKTEVAKLQSSNAEMDSGMTFINNVFENTQERVTALEDTKKASEDCFRSMEKRIQDYGLQSRPATVEIRNIPTFQEEKTTDLLAVLTNIGNVVKMVIHPNALRDIYRLKGKSDKIKPIVAEFHSVPVRNEFLDQVRKFNKDRAINDKLNSGMIGIHGSSQPIYVDDHLTPSMKKLFYEVRQYTKSKNYSCWQSNGRILVKKTPDAKPILIRSDQCFSNLKEDSDGVQQ